MSVPIGKIFPMTRRERDRLDLDGSLTRVELARLEGAVTALTQALTTFQTSVSGRLDDHESRIRLNERWRLSIPPSLITSLVALAVALFHH